MMLTRRQAFVWGAIGTLLAFAPFPLRAQEEATAESFIDQFGTKLVSVVNGEGTLAEKERVLRPLIEQSVDVDGIARFCLGRFVNTATPEQLRDYTNLFHSVLVDNITSKVGEFRGVSFRMGQSSERDGLTYVGTVVTRPNQAPTDVRWGGEHGRGVAQGDRRDRGRDQPAAYSAQRLCFVHEPSWLGCSDLDQRHAPAGFTGELGAALRCPIA